MLQNNSLFDFNFYTGPLSATVYTIHCMGPQSDITPLCFMGTQIVELLSSIGYSCQKICHILHYNFFMLGRDRQAFIFIP